jgi:hypothetical protein
MTDKRESLLEEINLLNARIRELRRYNKDCSFEMEELVRLILELDDLKYDLRPIDDAEDKID